MGCGAGILSTSLCRQGALVTGLDADSSVLEIANGYKKTLELSLRKQLQFVNGTVERFAEEKDTIGSCCSFAVSPNWSKLSVRCSCCLRGD